MADSEAIAELQQHSTTEKAKARIAGYSEEGVRMRLVRIYAEALWARQEGHDVRASLIIFLANE